MGYVFAEIFKSNKAQDIPMIDEI